MLSTFENTFFVKKPTFFFCKFFYLIEELQVKITWKANKPSSWLLLFETPWRVFYSVNRFSSIWFGPGLICCGIRAQASAW